MRNAIFETLVVRHNLPWDENIGAPDFSDPRVKSLHKELSEVLEAENETKTINGIGARCETKDYTFKTEGQAKIEKVDRILEECDLTEKCRLHHKGMGMLTQHNRFILYKADKQVGIASVSTQVCTGYIEPLE